MPAKARWIIVCLGVVIGLGVSYSTRLFNAGGHDFSVQTLEGESRSLADYKGKVLLVNIWDTVCPPCIKEFPGLTSLYADYKLQGLEILGMTQALYEKPSGVRAFTQKHNLNYPNAIVSRGVLERFGELRGIPVTYLIDQKGQIHKRYDGYQPREVFEADVKSLLERQAD